MDKYGPGAPGGHNKGPVVSEKGFRVGDDDSSIIAVDNEGALHQKGVKVNADASGIDAASDAAAVSAALVGVMVSGYASASHGDENGPIEVLAANGDGDGNRNILLIIKCTEELVTGGSTLPVFEIGDGEESDEFIKIGDGGDPATFGEGNVIVASGILVEERPLEITVTDGTGEGDPAGAIEVFAIALPVGSA